MVGGVEGVVYMVSECAHDVDSDERSSITAGLTFGNGNVGNLADMEVVLQSSRRHLYMTNCQ
jgi:hypothetical protein